MAGHSKWANTKYRKERADAKRGKIFSRVAKEIITAVKLGGPDAKNNPRLRLVLQKARDANLPNDIIDRNIKKASSPDQQNFVEMTYELYGHGGVGLVVEILSDNKNRTSSEIRIATNKCGGTIATPGAVTFNFERKGVIRLPKASIDEEKLFNIISEAGADEFNEIDNSYEIYTPPDLLYAVKEAIIAAGCATEEVELQMIPKSLVACDEETLKANIALIEWLEGLDDVDAVYHNMTAAE